MAVQGRKQKRVSKPSARTTSSPPQLPVKRVLVVGDIIVDRYVECRLYRSCPDGPCLALKVERRWSEVGAAACVAQNLMNSGLAVTLVGPFSGRYNGLLQNFLPRTKVNCDTFDVPRHETPRKLRYVVRGHILLRIDYEDPAGGGILDQWTAHVLKENLETGSYQGVFVLDYGKGAIGSNTRDVIGKIDLPVFLNTKTPAEFVGFKLKALIANEAEYDKMKERPDYEMILVTHGDRGMSLCTQPEWEKFTNWFHTNALCSCPISVVGAGDCAMAWLGASLLAGEEPHRALAVATAACGAAVAKPGNCVVVPSEFDHKIGDIRLDSEPFCDWR